MMNKANQVKQVFDCINSVLLAVLSVIVIVMALEVLPQFLEQCEVSEQNAISTEDTLRRDYMMSVGMEYEDTLAMDYSEQYDAEVEIYDSCEVTQELLENSDGGKVIIERCFGRVLDPETGDGEILNAYDEDFDYISYNRCEGIREGTLMMTYLVYNPSTSYTDDIMARYDVVVSHELED